LLIPRNSRLGFWLRRMQWLFWPMRVPRCDDSVRIHPTAIFSGFPENVELGRNVFIDAHAFIHCHKTGKIRIGDNSYVGLGAMVNTGKKGGFVTIGENCTVQAYSLVHGHGGCEIGNDVRIAGHTVIIPANHRFEDTTVTIREQGFDEERDQDRGRRLDGRGLPHPGRRHHRKRMCAGRGHGGAQVPAARLGGRRLAGPRRQQPF
jgi:hypothetical protein